MTENVPLMPFCDVAHLMDRGFVEVRELIQNARRKALQAVNTELVALYWQVGEFISRKIASAEWDDGVVVELARYLARTQPGLKGFTRPNLFRMRQLYGTYAGHEKVSALLRQLPWTHYLIILDQAKRPEERALYLKIAITKRWGPGLAMPTSHHRFVRATPHVPALANIVARVVSRFCRVGENAAGTTPPRDSP